MHYTETLPLRLPHHAESGGHPVFVARSLRHSPMHTSYVTRLKTAPRLEPVWKIFLEKYVLTRGILQWTKND